MRYKFFAAAVAAVVLWMVSGANAQQPDPNADPNAMTGGSVAGGMVVQSGGGSVRMAVVGGPGGGQAFMFPGGGAGMMGRDPLAGVINSLGELNLHPDFTLSADQKNKIQTVRDDFKSATEMWKKDHEEEITAIEEARKEMFDGLQQGNMPDPGRMMEIAEEQRVLFEDAPDGQAHIEQIKQILTEDQLKRLEERLAAQDKLMQEMLHRAPIRLQGGGGGVFVGQPGDQTDKDNDEKEKDEKKK